MTASQNYLNSLARQKFLVLRTMLVTCALAGAAFYLLPKHYKVSTTIALQTEYFQLPLVSGFLPETNDPQELRAKREALIRTALNREFISRIGERYPVLKGNGQSPQSELEQLNKKFEVIPNGPSSFIINFTANDPKVAYQVLQDFLARLQSIMTEERHIGLLNLHDAIREQLEIISFGKPGVGSSTIYALRPDLVRSRMESIQTEMENLRKSYSDKHPRISALQEELDQLMQWSKPWAESTNRARASEAFTGAKISPESRELFDDLLKKYRYLEVVIFLDQHNNNHYLTYLSEPFIPESPVSPKLPLLALWGLAAGFLAGSALVLFKQLALTSTGDPKIQPTPLTISRMNKMKESTPDEQYL